MTIMCNISALDAYLFLGILNMTIMSTNLTLTFDDTEHGITDTQCLLLPV